MINESYILITAAHNEETYIEYTIRSVLSQSVQPLKWVIVSDASTDRTVEIVKKYIDENSVIELVRLEEDHQYSFAAKAHAIRAAYDYIKDLQYSFLGILDADISFQPFYYSKLIDDFIENPKLGLTGGFIYEKYGETFISRRSNRAWSVAGAVQLFRRECYESIGGIYPLRYGGEDWRAEISARMMGWTVKACQELKVFHHRSTGTANSLLSYRFRQGRMDYSLGCLPVFEFAKCVRRLGEKPIVLGSLARLVGFVSSYCSKVDRPVSEEFVRFLRKEQTRRLAAIFSRNR